MNKRYLTIAAIAAIGLLTVANSLVLIRANASAARLSAPSIPQLISYQGRLTDVDDNPLDGTYNMTFRLYDHPTAGAPCWTESQNVTVDYGVFNVLLGDITPIPLDCFSGSDLYLGVEVGSDGEMMPRRRVVSVGYAYRAETASDAVPSGAIILWDGSNCPTGWTRVAELDGKFLVGGSSYSPSAGGSNTHTHTTPSHSHGFAAMSENPDSSGTSNAWNAPPAWDKPGSGSGAANFGDHQHNVSGTTSSWSGATDSADNRPEFATVVLCKKD